MTDGDPDEYTQHTACAILLGNKWIGNKWVGYNAQWNQKKCDKSFLHGFGSIKKYMQWKAIIKFEINTKDAFETLTI